MRKLNETNLNAISEIEANIKNLNDKINELTDNIKRNTYLNNEKLFYFVVDVVRLIVSPNKAKELENKTLEAILKLFNHHDLGKAPLLKAAKQYFHKSLSQ